MTPFRRWLLRTCFLLPLLLCMGGWVASHLLGFGISYTHRSYAVFCESQWGIVGLMYGNFVTTDGREWGTWEWETHDNDFYFLANEKHSLGFRFSKVDADTAWWREVIVPYWFLMVLFSLPLLYVWWKTRPKPSPTTALGDKPMTGFRRWFIRSCFMLPILLCVGGWGWSGTHYSFIKYSHDGISKQLASSSGVVTVNFEGERGSRPLFEEPDGWECGVTPVAPAQFWPKVDPALHLHSLFGFSIGGPFLFVRSGYEYSIPYWFLILVFSLTLFYAWRKTGPQKRPTGFPVEVK